MYKPRKSIPTVVPILVIVLILGTASYLAYNQINSWHNNALHTALEQARREWEEKIAALEETIADLKQELEKQTQGPSSREKLQEVFGTVPAAESFDPLTSDCEELDKRLKAFTDYLDKREYIAVYKLKNGTQGLLGQIVRKLSKNRPRVLGETRDLLGLMHNISHFNRVLDIREIKIIKAVLEQESDIMEPVMANFIAYFLDDDCCAHKTRACPSLEVLYEYAGFFLETLAGRSYLLRRDSTVRTLISYYCLLILDKANDETLNPIGIDIRPYIRFSFYDISIHQRLSYKKRYLEKIHELIDKYQVAINLPS